MKYLLSEQNIAAIERAINKATEAVVKIEQKKVVVLQVDKKKID